MLRGYFRLLQFLGNLFNLFLNSAVEFGSQFEKNYKH